MKCGGAVVVKGKDLEIERGYDGTLITMMKELCVMSYAL